MGTRRESRVRSRVRFQRGWPSAPFSSRVERTLGWAAGVWPRRGVLQGEGGVCERGGRATEKLDLRRGPDCGRGAGGERIAVLAAWIFALGRRRLSRVGFGVGRLRADYWTGVFVCRAAVVPALDFGGMVTGCVGAPWPWRWGWAGKNTGFVGPLGGWFRCSVAGVWGDRDSEMGGSPRAVSVGMGRGCGWRWRAAGSCVPP